MNRLLIEEIGIDLNSMLIIVNDVEELLKEVGASEPTNVQKTALGGFASQFYNGIENILKRILRYNEIELPKDENWHIKLLDRFSSDSDLPVKFSPEFIDELNDYRRFRHYFFHGYGHNLNWNILSSSVKNIREIYDEFRNEIMKIENK